MKDFETSYSTPIIEDGIDIKETRNEECSDQGKEI